MAALIAPLATGILLSEHIEDDGRSCSGMRAGSAAKALSRNDAMRLIARVGSELGSRSRTRQAPLWRECGGAELSRRLPARVATGCDKPYCESRQMTSVGRDDDASEMVACRARAGWMRQRSGNRRGAR